MVAKTGVARLALTSGAPVIPVAHWGTHEILRYGSKDLKLFPRKTVRTVAGPPVDLSKWAGGRLTATALREATAAIMAEVTVLVAGLRGEEPPAVPYDSASSPGTKLTSSPASSLPAQGQGDAAPVAPASSPPSPASDADEPSEPSASSGASPA
jgi:hypothetical protein